MSAKGLETDRRPLTACEKTLILWLIDHGSYANRLPFVDQLEKLTVHERCTCGCPTVYFALDGKPVSRRGEMIMSDYLATVSEQEVGVMLFETEGELSSLEVYSCAGSVQPFGLPKIETFRHV